VVAGETREVVVENGYNVGYIKQEDGTKVCELPLECIPKDYIWPCHVAGLDRGSVGTGGQNFIENDPRVDAFTFTNYDKFHGIIRNEKNAVNANRTYSEVFLTSSYVWGLNYKPFHSSEWYWAKQELLENFITTHDHESPIFKKYVGRISSGYGKAYFGTVDEDKFWFAQLSNMNSFKSKGLLGPRRLCLFLFNCLYIVYIYIYIYIYFMRSCGQANAMARLE